MIITKKLVAVQKRTSHTATLFGLNFPMRLEPVVYGLTDNLSEDYHGGYWDFWELSNGGFYMSPSSHNTFKVSCMNDYVGEMSADALGITACLYAYSHLSFGQESQFTDTFAQHYHWLREYALDHDESRAIMSAID
jgi:hypothetical protein